MSDLKNYVNHAKENGYSAPEEDVYAAFFYEENNMYLIVCGERADSNYWVSTYHVEQADYGEAIFESTDCVDCLNFCKGYILGA